MNKIIDEKWVKKNYNGESELILPNDVYEIANNAFYRCKSLTSIVIPEGTVRIGHNAFRECEHIENITLPKSLSEIGDGAFMNCESLKRIDIPCNIKVISNNMFESCEKLENITIPEGITEIGYGAFQWCKNLKAVSLPESLKTINSSAFFECNLESVVIPKNVAELGNGAFFSCKNLKSVILSDGLTKVGANTFFNCNKLNNVKLPSDLLEIERYAFGVCKELRDIFIPDSVVGISKTAFDDCHPKLTIHCSSGSYAEEYAQSQKYWTGGEKTTHKNPNIIEQQPLERIKEGCFYLFKDIDYNGTSVITRPILVIQSLNENKTLLGLKCTTTEREYDQYSYKLEDWREARLKSPSSVRCDKPIFLSSDNLLLSSAGKYIKIGHASARDMIAIAKTYDKYCDELKNLSQKLMKNVDKTRVYFVTESSTYSSGDTHTDMKIYSDYDSAKNEYNKMQPKEETVMANGKMQNKITEYETGYVCVDSAGNYDENKDIIVIEKKKYKGTNSQQQKQDSSQRRR